MCYVKSGKSAADIAAAAAAAAAAASTSTSTPLATDPFAFPDLFNLGADAFGTVGEGLDKWNFGELLNGVASADAMIPAEFPLFESNTFLTKWYGSETAASPSDSSNSASPTLVASNSSSVLLTPPANAAAAPSAVSPVNYFPQLTTAQPDIAALPPYLTYAPVAAPTPVEKPVAKKHSPSPAMEPLKPIKRSHEDHEACDPLAAKRQKNTEAARRSRQRKVEQMETLQGQVSELQGENSRLNVRLAVIESEREQWVAKENELMERIRNLERQLNESHMAVVSLGLKKANGVAV